RLLIAAGADPNARSLGKQFAETPLHWAASSDDLDVARALIDGGADLEAPDGSIGTPLGNAIGYACWNVSRLFVARGARVDTLWHAAALGITNMRSQTRGGGQSCGVSRTIGITRLVFCAYSSYSGKS